MLYTQEQLAAMTQDQLKELVMKLQNGEAVTVDGAQLTAAVSGAPKVDEAKAAVEADIANLDAKLADLENDGKGLYTTAVKALQEKRAELVEQLNEDINKGEQELQTWEEKFREDHGISPWVAAIGGGYIAWQVAAAVGRALGWF
ncbi:MAG: hypothetical protein ABFD79_13655 [Phycisphaerales bacterium]